MCMGHMLFAGLAAQRGAETLEDVQQAWEQSRDGLSSERGVA